MGHGREDVREVSRFVPAVAGMPQAGFREVAGEQVGGVCFQHKALERNAAHQFTQVMTTALVANPARNADVQVAVQVVLKFLAGAGEAVHYRSWQAW